MKISEIQKFVRDMLVKDAAVAASGAQVVCADEGDTVYETAKAEKETTGIIVVILAPKFTPTSKDAKCAVGDLNVTVRVAETPNRNRERADYTTGIALAEHISVLLNLEKPGPDHDLLVLVPPGIVGSPVDKFTVAWDVSFTTVHQLEGTRKNE
mgnify:CR=1 FL=1